MGARETPHKTSLTAAADVAFLHALGERVRDARARRGMTRKILARDSGGSGQQGGGQPVELALIWQFLQRLPAQKLPLVRSRLLRDFGTAHIDRMKRIALIGLRGAGKSTLGSRLAKELAVPFIELDREVEGDAGARLAENFLLFGQARYRPYAGR